MSAYLPKDSTGNSPYAEGGGLYALGLIHANHGGDIIEYLINQLRSNAAQTDVCQIFLIEIFDPFIFRRCVTERVLA
jgi:hypothetical protein